MPLESSSAIGLAVWSVAAAISLIFASSLALEPGYLADLWRVREWLAVWRSGGNPYVEFFDVDYPPNAFPLLVPFAWLSDAALPLVYVPLVIAATAAGTWIAAGWMARQFDIELRTRDRVVLVLLMLAGGSMRSGIWRGQTAPLALLAGAIALHCKQRRPILSTIALACCAFKPHVALGFGLAMVVTGHLLIPLAAGALAFASGWWFAAQAHIGFFDAWSGYIATLARLYDGPDRIRGLLSLRWVIEDAIDAYQPAVLISFALALTTAAFLLRTSQVMTDRSTRAKIVAAILLWTLLFFPHQLYHGWMAAPAVWLMMWPESGLIRNDRRRLWIVSAFVTFGVIDVPRLIRLVVDPHDNWTIGWWSYALSPLRLVAMFTLLLIVIGRRHAALARATRHAA